LLGERVLRTEFPSHVVQRYTNGLEGETVLVTDCVENVSLDEVDE
jgi:hypothetical protein